MYGQLDINKIKNWGVFPLHYTEGKIAQREEIASTS